MLDWHVNDVLDILGNFGMLNHPKSKPSSHHVMICCPFHNDKTPSLSVALAHSKVGVWKCFAGCGGGTFRQFIARHLGDEDKTKELVRKYHAPTEGSRYNFRPLTVPKDKVYEVVKWLEVVDELELEQYDDPHHTYAQKRGISKEICEKFRLGYDSKFPDNPSITFPIRKDGNYICICRRKIKKQDQYPQWNIPAGILKPIPYIDEAVERIKMEGHPKRVVVCEAFFDALSCWTKGIPAIALLGNPTDAQEALMILADDIREYVLAFDGDTAGGRMTEQLVEAFKDKKLVRVVNIPMGLDVNDCLQNGTFDEIVGKVYWDE
jgi:DNA primase